MTSSKYRSLAAVLLCLMIFISSVFPSCAYTDSDTILIYSAEDLIQLSEDCSFDIWSAGKKVYLMNDISLAGVSLEPIASFCGSFDGNGHSISDFVINGAYSPCGLFSVIEETGVVSNLDIRAKIYEEGELDKAAAICGVNKGTISGCSAEVIIKGETYIGGIVSVNETGGSIIDCSVSGLIIGTEFTGGICAYNSGTIRHCSNSASINTESIDTGLSLDDINLDFDSAVAALASGSTTIENTISSSDTGGIAGYSDGYIYDCYNAGILGYSHIGYNIGGICGRSCGYIEGCANYASIKGRKDVGGICGQLEPHIEILSESSVAQLRDELNTLTRLIDKTLADSENTSDEINAGVKDISESTDKAVNNLDKLSHSTTDFVDSNIEALNDISERVDYVMDNLPAVLEDAEYAISETSLAITKLNAVNTDLKMSAADRSSLRTASSNISAAGIKFNADTASLRQHADELETLVSTGAIHTYTDMVGKLSEIITDLGNIADDASVIVTNAVTVTDILTRYIAENIPKAQDDLTLAINYLNSAVTYLNSATVRIDNIIINLNKRDDVEFSKLDENYNARLSDLFTNVRDASDKLNALSDTLNTDSALVIEDLKAVNNQLNKLVNMFVDIFVEAQDKTISDVFLDDSALEYDEITLGKIKSSRNHGTINADRSVGGIAGAIEIENSADPESEADLTGTSIFSTIYKTRAVIQGCKSSAQINAKKNCVGGICGNMELGIIAECEGYGSVQSETGNYVGGIAGMCRAVITDCRAKCSLAGDDYIGGIIGCGDESSAFGSGSAVRDCISLVNITEGLQFCGAISGFDSGEFSNNFYVSDTLRGLNRTSVAGKAEPTAYDELLKIADLPFEFKKFSLTFIAGDTVIKELSFSYGDSFDESVFPQADDIDGQYYRWDKTDLTNLRFDTVVTAVYMPDITCIESDCIRDDSRHIFLAEGLFKAQDALLAAERTDTPSDAKNALSACFGDPMLFISDNSLSAFRMYSAIEELWTVNIPDDGAATHTLRYLPPDYSPDDYVIFEMTENGYRAVDAEIIGSYICFETDGEETQIAVVRTSPASGAIALLAVFAAAAVLLVFLIVRRKRKRRNKKSNA